MKGNMEFGISFILHLTLRQTPNHWQLFHIPTGRFQGLTFPGAYGFCCGPLDFSDQGPKIIRKITRNPVLDWSLSFIKLPFWAPSLKSKCQTVGYIWQETVSSQ